MVKKTKFLPLWSLHSSREREVGGGIINRQATQETEGVVWRETKQKCAGSIRLGG